MFRMTLYHTTAVMRGRVTIPLTEPWTVAAYVTCWLSETCRRRLRTAFSPARYSALWILQYDQRQHCVTAHDQISEWSICTEDVRVEYILKDVNKRLTYNIYIFIHQNMVAITTRKQKRTIREDRFKELRYTRSSNASLYWYTTRWQCLDRNQLIRKREAQPPQRNSASGSH